MVKIFLDVCDYANGLRAIVTFFVKCDEIKLKLGIVKFIVDSGSPETILGLDDIKRLRISMNKIQTLESRKFPVSYGGANLKMKILNNMVFKITNFEKLKSVLVPTELGNSEIAHPSILGVDFLKENKLKFVFNPSKKEAYFETED